MFDIITKGGVFMYPILVCSVISLAVILERFFNCRKSLIVPFELYLNLKKHFLQNEIEAAKNILNNNKTIFANLINFVFMFKDRETTKNLIDENGKRELQRASFSLQILSTIASIAPLLGLLGTVTGMIKVFSVLSIEGASNPENLALGISEALFTTVGGLIVAIISFVFFKYFQARLNSIFVSLEEKTYELMDILFKISEEV